MSNINSLNEGSQPASASLRANNAQATRKIEASLKMRFLATIGKDGKLKPTAFKVAFALVNFCNADRGYAWLGINRLVEETAASPASVKSAIKLLEAEGWFRIKRQRKFGKSNHDSNHYYPAWSRCDLGDHAADESNLTKGRSNSDPYTVKDYPVILDPVKKQTQEAIDGFSNDNNKPSDAEVEVASVKPPRQTATTKLVAENDWPDDAFIQFWEAYPKKKERRDTQKLFEEKRKELELPFEVLMREVRSYAKEVDRERTEERFITSPIKYLSGHRWEDETRPKPKPKLKRNAAI